MKKYTEQSNHWKFGKALRFLVNFLKNHQKDIGDNDTFAPIAELFTTEELHTAIRETFPAKTLTRMLNYKEHRNRLDFEDPKREVLREIWCQQFARTRLRKLLVDTAEKYLAAIPLDKYRDDLFARRAAELQKTLSLSDLELDILLVLSFINSGILCIADGHNRRSDENDKAVFVAKCLNCELPAVLRALGENEKLRRYGCVDDDIDFNPELSEYLNGVRNEPICSNYFSVFDEEVLPWDFYGALAEKHGAILKRIIQSANGKTPVNILLYGAPGTGKTSFARTLAAELGRRCYTVAQCSKEQRSRIGGFYSSPSFRFGALLVCNGQVDPTDSLIVVDEADAMLRSNESSGFFSIFGSGSGRPSGDKGLLNSVLDTVTTPTIWITNTCAAELDKSSCRRFDYSIRFDALTNEQRLSIWRNNVEKMKLGKLISDKMMQKFASRYGVSAGGITLTLKNIAKLAPEPAEVEELVDTLMKPHCELLGVEAPGENIMLPAEDYSLEGLNVKGSVKLDRIITAVRNFRQETCSSIDRPRMNILLSGAPGTGKTEFVKYLGAQLGAKVVVKMCSDLLNMYVGGTEKLIKEAFQQAEAENAILFLDEIDGLLQNRERAHQNWEVSQVNELLHWMENFKGVMIGATNFSANLDSAVLRRFTFKLEFDYLDAAGKKLFFERMFNTVLTDAEAARLANIPRLAPGDYRTVRQSFFYLGGEVSNADRLEALERESAAKNSNRCAERTRVGF